MVNMRPLCVSGEEEALHGKLEDDRFLFSLENDSAACDVLDLREVRSILLRSRYHWGTTVVLLIVPEYC